MGEVLQKDIRFAREAILNDILEILEDLTSDWEMEFLDKIGPETRLVSDLTFESIDIVQLSVSVEEHFDHRRLPFVLYPLPVRGKCAGRSCRGCGSIRCCYGPRPAQAGTYG